MDYILTTDNLRKVYGEKWAADAVCTAGKCVEDL